MSNRQAYYKAYAARRRELDKARRATPEGKAEQLRIRYARIAAIERATTHTEWDEFVREEADALCKVRNEETCLKWEPDHMIPLRAKTCSGLNCGDNIQVIPASLNRSKKNRMILTQRNEWLRFMVL
ncbi:hypothetical protein pEaSNUABM56_00244 [Erwinia phage pEa_SNUABM_56]|uniref:HNH endonuclease n=1 Tax=Erwinia phage pEp_SNUABM_01 TaxID=2601643 RepID=A0A5J6DAV5_9CAUD|nr:hypothetical protein HWC63_gp159 [Erwinia phage pEp_SNUABM_01]QEQ95019.1 hypothetical protein pEpSNUABM01_193 [Erwinia phage pEp_SNUABM_01]UYL84946.1 hypothetical protein pEaSNUABM55_00173 [Erwinia phage pEa_SNUABM_55]UYL85264.1 hypothetical protein pEaSNUABM56_00244 [Erwinia phage pEa_SNUABM_56]